MKNLKKLVPLFLFFLKKNGEFEAHDDAKKIMTLFSTGMFLFFEIQNCILCFEGSVFGAATFFQTAKNCSSCKKMQQLF